MNENNDFLKSYNKKNKEEIEKDTKVPSQAPKEKSEPVTPSKAPKQQKDTTTPPKSSRPQNSNQDSMSFHEKSGFEKSQRTYSPPPPRNSYGGGRNNGNGKRTKNIITAILVTFSLCLIIIMLLFSGIGKIKVPAMSGWDKNQFMLWANENKMISQVEEQYNETVETGKIISQSVNEGEKISKKSHFKVVISKGPDLSVELDLPDIMNMSKADIENWANQNLMTKVRITSEYHATKPLGRVIKYEINDNTVVDKVKRNTPIYIVISKGAENVSQKEIKIPDFKPMGVSETIVFAQENGLNITVEEKYDDYIPKNSIISQSAKKDEILHPGDNLKIVVSLGQKKVMISFKGIPKEEAMSKASQLGLTVTIKERYSSSSKGRMIWQSIDEGTIITEDMKLELSYSLGSTISLSSYVGQPKLNIEQWLVEENAKGARATIHTTYTQNSAAPGTIISQDKSNVLIKRDTTINIVVSSGDVIYVPDFVAPENSNYDVAITREKAQALVAGMDIVLVFKEEAKTGRLPGEVWYQSIAPGKEVHSGSTITLKYNPMNSTINVGNFVGKTEQEIKTLPEYLNQKQFLNLVFVVGEFKSGFEGKVYSQSIAYGTTVANGTTVTLTVSPTLVVVPDFSVMSQTDAQNNYGDKFELTFLVGTQSDPPEAAGTIYEQSTAANETVPKGSAITLKVRP